MRRSFEALDLRSHAFERTRAVGLHKRHASRLGHVVVGAVAVGPARRGGRMVCRGVGVRKRVTLGPVLERLFWRRVLLAVLLLKHGNLCHVEKRVLVRVGLVDLVLFHQFVQEFGTVLVQNLLKPFGRDERRFDGLSRGWSLDRRSAVRGGGTGQLLTARKSIQHLGLWIRKVAVQRLVLAGNLVVAQKVLKLFLLGVLEEIEENLDDQRHSPTAEEIGLQPHAVQIVFLQVVEHDDQELVVSVPVQVDVEPVQHHHRVHRIAKPFQQHLKFEMVRGEVLQENRHRPQHTPLETGLDLAGKAVFRSVEEPSEVLVELGLAVDRFGLSQILDEIKRELEQNQSRLGRLNGLFQLLFLVIVVGIQEQQVMESVQ
ncbi:hypothetical protein OGAPHI_006511 [Ogataea philodendri]|uniref:Uncharacterized protein n=1 Tax=Ogataea philodendri TaxID=1378263 RepID=A0A9P8NYP3_9ASCO|nr:uncharacterized protein OGAPHI_006511 [Ogataea philodendri]KAH3661661.1 hypothetical protein OGAPHI_006511 [Ogataea philodendri]